MILDGKKVFEEYETREKDIWEKFQKEFIETLDKDTRDRLATIAVIRINEIREMRDRLSVLQIKA